MGYTNEVLGAPGSILQPPRRMRGTTPPHLGTAHGIYGGEGLCQRTRSGSPKRTPDFGVCQSDVI